MTLRTQKRRLARKATELLLRAGYTANGRKQRDLNWAQLVFERRLVMIPMGGQRKSR